MGMLRNATQGGPATKKVRPDTIKRVLRLFIPYKPQVIITVVTVLIASLIGLAPFFFLSDIVNQGILNNNLAITTRYSIYTILFTIAASGLTLYYGYLSVLMGQRIMRDLRNQLFVHLQGMSLKFFSSTRVGEIQSRLINDVSGVQGVVSAIVTDALSNVTTVISALIAMFLFDWRLTLLSVGILPIFAVVGSRIGNYARGVTTSTQKQMAELNAMMAESLSISGVLLIKTSGRRELITRRFELENEGLSKWQVQSQMIPYYFFGLIRFIFTLTPAAVYWLAGYFIARGDKSITMGMLVAFTALQSRLFFPLTSLMNVQVQLLSTLGFFDRIFEYTDMPQDIVDRPNARPLLPAQVQGRVAYNHVQFSYDPDAPTPTLQEIDFEALPGQLIALVGPSGAGKTTLTYFIPRLYDVDKGSVTIDGIDVRDIQLDSLGQIVGAVTQETYLVHASVAENLRYGKPDATDEEIAEAAKMAAIHDHIAGLPEGYETMVGERGYKLSGGEKQRLAIARAILKNPRILILDEATSSLDTASERLIQNSLKGLMAGRTTFAIAHRLSTILAADLILVLDNGRIVERGKHHDLLKLNGLYAGLYNEQFQEQEVLA
ncbi:MAG TPA: ABC transporter ATP-binding protein [Fimbriimonadaceae bacterium]|jgi:ATP-binding cassette subfamily B protein